MLPAPRPAADAPAPEIEEVEDDQELILEDLTHDQVLDWRARAAAWTPPRRMPTTMPPGCGWMPS
ncbi:hypothetical protein [Streptomyces noursei]|uniref:hypothetical protein n=1 Tax=Streptomyces noursei TaxID=1971 RepID=UPI0030F329C8